MSTKLKILNVELGDKSYPIYIGRDLFSDKTCLEKHISGQQVMVVTNSKIEPLYLDKVKNLLGNFEVQVTILPDGEQYKTLETVNSIFDALLEAKFDRSTTLIALGGGVVGDITGFAAASYLRGVDFIQIPTTLLSQVDSSVGGKTGVNHTLGKNMIGAFHQPRAVIIDVDTLDTLPIREFSAGMAEVIKYGLLTNIDFLSDLEKNIDSIKRGLHQEDKELLIDAIYRSCADKAEIVSLDEFESSVRRLLNLGHTFGHGIENVLGYGTYLHGEAVAIGMCMAARLSQLEGNLSVGDVDRVKSILTLAGLPCSIGKYNITATQLYKAMLLDKKVIDGNIRLVLFLWLGNAYISQDYSEENLKQVLSEFCHS